MRHVKAKQHFFTSLDLNDLLVPVDDREGAFTGMMQWAGLLRIVCSNNTQSCQPLTPAHFIGSSSAAVSQRFVIAPRIAGCL